MVWPVKLRTRRNGCWTTTRGIAGCWGGARRAEEIPKPENSLMAELQGMPHLGLFSFQVFPIVLAGLGADRDLVDNGQPIAFDSINLARVVGHDANLPEPEIAKDLAADAVIALVGGQAQLQVGFHGIQAFFLKGVGVKL